jgi:Smg protein
MLRACPAGCSSATCAHDFHCQAASVGYIGSMYDVLVFVYENYWHGGACPETEQLSVKLSSKGFEASEIADALNWLDGLRMATAGLQGESDDSPEGVSPREQASMSIKAAILQPQSPHSMRVYSIDEQEHLGAQCLGFLRFLEDSQVLPAGMREVIIERAMAAPDAPLSLEELKIIVLMVYWSTGIEPDALVLDELCDDPEERIAH